MMMIIIIIFRRIIIFYLDFIINYIKKDYKILPLNKNYINFISKYILQTIQNVLNQYYLDFELKKYIYLI
jgi:hypothetical protein